MRTLPVLLLAAGIVASLTSCATAPFTESCHSSVHAGDASNVVTATGAFGTQPTVNFPTPIVAKKIERTQLLPGDGPTVSDGDVVVIKYVALNGVSGEIAGQGDYSGPGQAVTLGKSTLTAVSKGLECATVGSRVAITSSATAAGQNPTTAASSFVFVIDILKAFPGKAWGTPQIPQAGMPSVVTAPNGTPGITVPKEDPPTTLKVNALQVAPGKKVKAGDTVIVKYTGVLWSDSSVFDSTWTDGQAKYIPLKVSDTVTKGFVKGLVGQTIGSQVLIVAPPSFGFGSAGSNNVPSGSTLIYVVDILGVDG
ncbi:MAG: FKBP-type peptidyl-prolyl cis-trans isomerase [Cryobacterium sp.]|nr:FKBP-type peptidyl-prolyl cis-trans isomerase [Cryobacterium sp.]